MCLYTDLMEELSVTVEPSRLLSCTARDKQYTRVYLINFLGINNITGLTLNNMASIETLIIGKLPQEFYEKMLHFGSDIPEENGMS